MLSISPQNPFSDARIASVNKDAPTEKRIYTGVRSDSNPKKSKALIPKRFQSSKIWGTFFVKKSSPNPSKKLSTLVCVLIFTEEK
jgi:hypothetical protein